MISEKKLWCDCVCDAWDVNQEWNKLVNFENNMFTQIECTPAVELWYFVILTDRDIVGKLKKLYRF